MNLFSNTNSVFLPEMLLIVRSNEAKNFQILYIYIYIFKLNYIFHRQFVYMNVTLSIIIIIFVKIFQIFVLL